MPRRHAHAQCKQHGFKRVSPLFDSKTWRTVIKPRVWGWGEEHQRTCFLHVKKVQVADGQQRLQGVGIEMRAYLAYGSTSLGHAGGTENALPDVVALYLFKEEKIDLLCN